MKAAEKNLILACSRIELSPDIVPMIRDCASKVLNWHNFLQEAMSHGMVPLLYTHLKKTCPDLIAADVMSQLRGMYVRIAQKNLAFAAVLLKVLNMFKAHDILAVPFKGPLLAQQVYGDITLRQFNDLDILIKKHDAVRARKLLVDYGYEAEIELRGRNESKYLEYENSFSFISRNGGPSIDLHWEMTGRYLLSPISIEYFEKTLQPTDLLDQKVLSIPDDIMLVYLCTHGTSHCWERLEWVCCFTEMLRRKDEAGLFKIIAMAEKLGCKRMLYLGFFLGYDLLGVKLPKNIKEKVFSDSGVFKYGVQLKKSIFYEKQEVYDGDAKWRFSPIHIQLRDSYPDRLNYARYLYFTPTIKELEKFSLPGWLAPLYGVLRPIRLGAAVFSAAVPKKKKTG